MSLGIKLKFDVLRSLAYTSITSSYVAVGTPLAYQATSVLIQNLTNDAVVFSFDGINDAFVLPASGYLLEDITSNKIQSNGLFISIGESLWVKNLGTPSGGSVYFSVMYISEK